MRSTSSRISSSLTTTLGVNGSRRALPSISSRRSTMSTTVVSSSPGVGWLMSGVLCELATQRLGTRRRHGVVDRSTEAEHLLDDRRGDEDVAERRHQEDGVDVGVETAIHQGHLELVLEVAGDTQAAYDGDGADALRKVHGEPVEGVDLDLGGVLDGPADEVDALLGREQWRLRRVAEDAHDNTVEDQAGALEDVQVLSLIHISEPTRQAE